MSVPFQTDQAVQDLLGAYATYKRLNAQLKTIESQLTMAKLRKDTGEIASLQPQYTKLKRKLDEVSESMTYASPLIWVRYKYEAYQNEAQPINNLRDLRLHCSKPGYICTKRFAFVNAYLRNRHEATLEDRATYSDTLELPHIYELLQELSDDQQFINEWQRREYYQVDGRVAKWELE